MPPSTLIPRFNCGSHNDPRFDCCDAARKERMETLKAYDPTEENIANHTLSNLLLKTNNCYRHNDPGFDCCDAAFQQRMEALAAYDPTEENIANHTLSSLLIKTNNCFRRTDEVEGSPLSSSTVQGTMTPPSTPSTVQGNSPAQQTMTGLENVGSPSSAASSQTAGRESTDQTAWLQGYDPRDASTGRSVTREGTPSPW